MSPVLVIGGSGSVGTQLIAALLRGTQLIAALLRDGRQVRATGALLARRGREGKAKLSGRDTCWI
jgi:uncharacterized protein YbjT (DUF2867 family)